jgi:hypothetical protein
MRDLEYDLDAPAGSSAITRSIDHRWHHRRDQRRASQRHRGGLKALTGSILIGFGDMMIEIGTQSLLAAQLLKKVIEHFALRPRRRDRGLARAHRRRRPPQELGASMQGSRRGGGAGSVGLGGRSALLGSVRRVIGSASPPVAVRGAFTAPLRQLWVIGIDEPRHSARSRRSRTTRQRAPRASVMAKARIVFNDGVSGSVTLQSDYPIDVAGRFQNWQPDTSPQGPAVNALADERSIMFRTSTRYGCSFEMHGLLMGTNATTSSLNIANRLKAHLERWRLSGDHAGRERRDVRACGIMPGTVPEIYQNARALEYAIRLSLINRAAAEMVCNYQ